MNTMNIADNISAVRAVIAQHTPNPERVKIVGATKMNDAATVRAAVAAGLDICGENRVQELLEKYEQGAYEGAPLHFIGHLQKNKVKYLVGKVSLIHSVDTLALMDEIDRIARKNALVQDILLELNIAGEEAKSGFSPEEIDSALRHASALSGLRVRGLMTVAPKCASPEENRPVFQQMHQLFVDISEKKYDNVFMDFLSMGMSGDYPAAVECGANLVRIGTAIFGERRYAAQS